MSSYVTDQWVDIIDKPRVEVKWGLFGQREIDGAWVLKVQSRHAWITLRQAWVKFRWIGHISKNLGVRYGEKAVVVVVVAGRDIPGVIVGCLASHERWQALGRCIPVCANAYASETPL
jgi:hypothetical protein